MADQQTYTILAVQFEPDHREERRAYHASSVGEALLMAEREDAGVVQSAPYTYGIAVEHFEAARAEGIRFNQADGLLID